MEQTRTRYPGAQPFADDTISRAIFFGREKEAAALTDQIIANRLVVIYAKSGLGKTSLLHAGVCQPLRDDGFLPLIVRVNDIKQGPVRSIYDGIRMAAERQKIEYQPGSELSLWHFFKTAEFWRGDLLLTPVLILDQFEELFTLHSPEVRVRFLAELGSLIRGTRPDINQSDNSGISTDTHLDSSLTDTPPKLQIALSLREDFLGSLEEASDDITEILDHRFRLTPLDLEAAKAAMIGPGKVEDKHFVTQPFDYDEKTIHVILDYLSRRTKTTTTSSTKFVEPFHLQLICQRVESVAAKRQTQTETTQLISLSDLGGEKGLKTTLTDFYNNILKSIKKRSTRKKVRSLCEQHLISPDGRRISLEEEEIGRLLGLEAPGLKWLVNHRLLRCEQRADSWYYELSHDSLIEPILATRKLQDIFLELINLLGTMIVLIIGLTMTGGFPLAFYTILKNNDQDYLTAAIVSAVVAIIGIILLRAGFYAFRHGSEKINRHIKSSL